MCETAPCDKKLIWCFVLFGFMASLCLLSSVTSTHYLICVLTSINMSQCHNMLRKMKVGVHFYFTLQQELFHAVVQKITQKNLIIIWFLVSQILKYLYITFYASLCSLQKLNILTTSGVSSWRTKGCGDGFLMSTRIQSSLLKMPVLNYLTMCEQIKSRDS